MCLICYFVVMTVFVRLLNLYLIICMITLNQWDKKHEYVYLAFILGHVQQLKYIYCFRLIFQNTVLKMMEDFYGGFHVYWSLHFKIYSNVSLKMQVPSISKKRPYTCTCIYICILFYFYSITVIVTKF